MVVDFFFFIKKLKICIFYKNALIYQNNFFFLYICVHVLCPEINNNFCVNYKFVLPAAH